MNMSNKIKSVFRFKGAFSEKAIYGYSFFSASKKELFGSLGLISKVSLKKISFKDSFKISVDSRVGKFRKELKKKLGFLSYFLEDFLTLNKKPIIRFISLIGTGFKVFRSRDKKVEDLIFKIGLSHLVKISVPTGMEFRVIKFNLIKFHSLDKELIGSFLNFVASTRLPDSYKGRGLLISNKPKIKLKRGKVKN